MACKERIKKEYRSAVRIGGFSKRYEVMSADSLQKSVGKAGASHRKNSSKRKNRTKPKAAGFRRLLGYTKKEEKAQKARTGMTYFVMPVRGRNRSRTISESMQSTKKL